MHQVVFIGGPADGKRETVNELLYYMQVMQPKPFNYKSFSDSDSIQDCVAGTVHNYRLESFCGISMYVHQGDNRLGPQEIIQKLLDGYYPRRPNGY